MAKTFCMHWKDCSAVFEWDSGFMRLETKCWNYTRPCYYNKAAVFIEATRKSQINAISIIVLSNLDFNVLLETRSPNFVKFLIF